MASMSATETAPLGALLPMPLRRSVYLVIAVCTGIFLWLALRVAGGSRAGEVDRMVSRAAYKLLPQPIIDLIPLGDAVPVIVVALMLSSLAFGLRLRRCAVLAILGPLLTGSVTTGAKPLVGRTIREHLSYPSGHTGAWTSLGLVAALIAIGWLSPRPTTRAVALAVGAIIPGGAMALALVRFSSHYPSDTVGGFCAAVVCVLGAALLLERIGARSPRRSRAEQGVPNDGDGGHPIEPQ